VLLVAAKDRIGSLKTEHQHRIQSGGRQVDARMSDSGAIPIDDCGQLLLPPQGVALLQVTVQQNRSPSRLLALGKPRSALIKNGADAEVSRPVLKSKSRSVAGGRVDARWLGAQCHAAWRQPHQTL
jgi:hypothetical protein